ncbi:histidine kinase [Virgisporangium aliadipatigenens]|uniref:histidine kinase n=1 Tax=Virgisporangium aliadipatigenens TaxID=741659 RepID=A0A8J4DT56_9ACTN|nr:sensor histidine kinase [Virgisporangium aliadipatigenens]GIJ48568.1 histidine kinase [Virgisporangium aliadipatigenens]
MTTLAPPAAAADWRRRVLPDSVYALAGLPYGLVSFAVLIAGTAIGIASLVTVVGVPILAGTLLLARAFAEGERRALAAVSGLPYEPVEYKRVPPGAGVWRRIITPLTDGQCWLDLAHGLIAFPAGLSAFFLAVLWWVLTLGGCTYALWSWSVPDSDEDIRLPELLGLPDTWFSDVTVHTGLGLVAAASLPLVLRAAVILRAASASWLLFAVGGLRGRINDLEEEKATAQAQTVAAVTAEANALRRLERDIHDGPQQRLVRLAMDLGRVQHQLENDPEAARATVAEALAQTRETLDELRALSRGIAPPILADRGLTAAIAALAGRSLVPVDVDAPDLGRLDPALENAAYFVIAESLTNVAKHSLATECGVSLRSEFASMIIEITDNGVGGAHTAKGHGLSGLSDRVHAIGGILTVDSPVGGPTTVTAELPLGGFLANRDRG